MFCHATVEFRPIGPSHLQIAAGCKGHQALNLGVLKVRTLPSALDTIHKLMFRCFVLRRNQSLSEGGAGFQVHWDVMFTSRFL